MHASIYASTHVTVTDKNDYNACTNSTHLDSVAVSLCLLKCVAIAVPSDQLLSSTQPVLKHTTLAVKLTPQGETVIKKGLLLLHLVGETHTHTHTHTHINMHRRKILTIHVVLKKHPPYIPYSKNFSLDKISPNPPTLAL